MKLSSYIPGLALTALATASLASPSTGITAKQIKDFPGAFISYDKTHICEINAKAYSGYVRMPLTITTSIQGDRPYNI
jgi:hypothetical protein